MVLFGQGGQGVAVSPLHLVLYSKGAFFLLNAFFSSENYTSVFIYLYLKTTKPSFPNLHARLGWKPVASHQHHFRSLPKSDMSFLSDCLLVFAWKASPLCTRCVPTQPLCMSHAPASFAQPYL